MPVSMSLPAHLRPRREKVFGDGRPRPLDRNAKVRILHQARALMRRTEKGRAYGAISAKAYAVLEALLFAFHNARSGLCFPSYESIAEKAGCARSTVAECIKALEEAGILSWVNRIVRIRERCEDLFGRMGTRWRVIRTSNAYHFRDPLPSKLPDNLANSSKSGFPAETSIQEFLSSPARPKPASPPLDPNLTAALSRLGKALGAVS
ncbi:helix-turn-helix domain-containing protein [Rhodoblastus sp.]|uniref:helix-turn-helix domain-containing protein n=1 Tax=Rhodoblastus sp. TaxID=1962975 RepID=UPI003F9E6F41